MRTVQMLMATAKAPWSSLDAISAYTFTVTPQEEIDFCLSCRHCDGSCDRCDGRGNLRMHKNGSLCRGRPGAEIDTALLLEMLAMNRRNKEMCAALGISEPTLIKAKKRLTKGGEGM